MFGGEGPGARCAGRHTAHPGSWRDMPVRELYTEDFISICYDAEEAWLYADWRGYQTVGTVQAGCEMILKLMVDQETSSVLNDNTHVSGIWSGAAEWVATDWFPRMRQAGLRSFAWVYSPSRFSQVSTDATLAHVEPDAPWVKVFSTIDDAKAWLRARR